MRIGILSAILCGAASLLLGQPNIDTSATTVNGVLTPAGMPINPNQNTSVTAVFQDRGAGLSYAFFTFETYPSASYSCKIGVQIGSPVSTSNIYLHDDNGTSLGPMWFGSGFQESNSKCSLNVTGSNVTLSGGQYTVTVNVVFKDPYNGVKYTWLDAYDTNGMATDWIYGNANFTIPTQDYPPQTVTVSPSSGSNQVGQVQQFSYTVNDTNGAFTVYHSELVFNKGGNWIPGYQPTTRCKIIQDANFISLENDTQNGYVNGGYAPFGSSQAISNSQCTVYPSQSRGVATSLQSETITFAVAFTSSFSGQLQDHIFAKDNLGLSTWDTQADGIWTWTLTSSGAGTVLLRGTVLTGGGDNSPYPNASVSLSGQTSATTTTDTNGNYQFTVAAGGNFIVTPSQSQAVFTPTSLSYSNVTSNQQGIFSVLPPGYNSAPSSIAGSYNAPDPQPSCTDATGLWYDFSVANEGYLWNITQMNNSITGNLSYHQILGGDPNQVCGNYSYNVAGLNNSGQFALTATLSQIYSGNVSCNYTPPNSITESGSLSGRTCGVGNFTSSTSGGGGPATSGGVPSMASTNNPMSLAVPQQAPPSSNWTSAVGRFVVQYAAYIPIDHIMGPPAPCLVNVGGSYHADGFLLYKGDANRGTYRTTESVLVIPALKYQGQVFARGGPTRNYQWPSSPRSGYFTNLSSSPTGDLWNSPYSGSDEDEVQSDCRFWNAKGEADNSTMKGVGASLARVSTVNLYGSGQDPLEPKFGGIKWNLTTTIDQTDPNKPQAFVSTGTQTCYPAHTVKVNGTTVYDSLPTLNNTVFLLTCLTQSGFSVTPSSRTAVSPF